MDRGAWQATVSGVTRIRHDWATNTFINNKLNYILFARPIHCVCVCVFIYIWMYVYICGLPWWYSGKKSACQCRRYRGCKRHGFNPWVKKISWSRKRQPIPVFLPGKFHGQRSLAGYSPGGHRESTWLSDWAHTHTHTRIYIHNTLCNIYYMYFLPPTNKKLTICQLLNKYM